MEKISISPIANPSFSTTIDDVSYDFQFRFRGDFMVYDLSVNGSKTIEGFRMVTGQLLLPYDYQQMEGNFILDVTDDDEPNYENFGSTQFLYYLDVDETRDFKYGN